jgi:predicted homoserine dehydrogenase-like protein
MYKPSQVIALDLCTHVECVGLRCEPAGHALTWRGDVIASPERDHAASKALGGEAGYTVYGKLMPARDSLHVCGLMLGLEYGVNLVRAVAAGVPVRWESVVYDAAADAVKFGREMEAAFAGDRSPVLYGRASGALLLRNPKEDCACP